MLDSSCGRMFWMPLVLDEVEQQNSDFRFMGTDVVCSLIDKHVQTYANRTNWQFQCVHYSNQPLPKGYELIWSRDSLQHLPMHAAYQFLNNVKASGTKYLLVGSYVGRGSNRDIGAGDCYNVDLTKPPLNASPSVEIISEQDAEGKSLVLFEVANMSWDDTLPGLI